MLSKRSKMIILVVSCLLVIFLLIWFLMKPQIPKMRGGLNINASGLPESGRKFISSANINQAPTFEEPKTDLAVTLKSLASAFSERYGSFSNQSNFKNLRDLSPLMTDQFSTQTDEYIKRQEDQSIDTDVYYGITSKTVKNKLISLNKGETEAIIELTMQRREAKESINDNVRIFYQGIVIELKKERGEWKINSAEWRK